MKTSTRVTYLDYFEMWRWLTKLRRQEMDVTARLIWYNENHVILKTNMLTRCGPQSNYGKTQNMFAFPIILLHQNAEGGWNPSSRWEYVVNIICHRFWCLRTCGSATMVLILIYQNISNSEGLKKTVVTFIALTTTNGQIHRQTDRQTGMEADWKTARYVKYSKTICNKLHG